MFIAICKAFWFKQNKKYYNKITSIYKQQLVKAEFEQR